MRRIYSEVKIVVEYFKHLNISDLRPPDKNGREGYFKKKNNLQTAEINCF